MSTLQVFTLILVFSTAVSACLNKVSRKEWGASKPNAAYTSIANNLEYVFIHHTAGGTCSTKSACITRAKSIQDYHMNTNNWDDIGYSFLIGDDGNVYPGRGWGYQGAHTSGYNDKGYGIAIFGDFTSATPSDNALDALVNLIAEGVTLGYLKCDYTLRGHKDMVSTSCPGAALYDIIKEWPHY